MEVRTIEDQELLQAPNTPRTPMLICTLRPMLRVSKVKRLVERQRKKSACEPEDSPLPATTSPTTPPTTPTTENSTVELTSKRFRASYTIKVKEEKLQSQHRESVAMDVNRFF